MVGTEISHDWAGETGGGDLGEVRGGKQGVQRVEVQDLMQATFGFGADQECWRVGGEGGGGGGGGRGESGGEGIKVLACERIWTADGTGDPERERDKEGRKGKAE